MKKMMSCLLYGGYALWYLFAYCLGLLARHFPYYKNLWLIAERKTDARDNGLHLFRHITRIHPEINAAFIIKRDSPDYDRVKKLGKVIEPYTFRHMLAFACARVRVSTHYMGCSPDPYRFRRLEQMNLIFGKNAVIQHGIIANDIPELHYPVARPDLLVCSAVPEYKNMVENYGHPEGVIQMLGLCRFDRLKQVEAPKRQILIMPTWRYFLRGLSDETFKNSQYYQNFMDILSNDDLQKKLEVHDYRIVFYLHYELQPYTDLFRTDHPRIEVRRISDSDVQDLLMESAMLITDYSSVFFDFAYMRKPLAYFPFDEERFYETQYKRGYFNVHTDGFGPVFFHPDEIAGYICEKLETGMEMDTLYRNRASLFFSQSGGGGHCERTVLAIQKLL